MVVGDFNVHHPVWGGQKTSPSAELIVDWVSSTSACLLNSSQPTFFKSGCRPSLLDLSIVSSDLFLSTNLYVHNDTFDSDHSPIEIKIPNLTAALSPLKLRTRWTHFAADINKELDSMESVSADAFALICTSTKNANSAPFPSPPTKAPPWWTPRCSFLLGKKRRLIRIAKKNPLGAEWLAAKRVGAQLRRAIKILRRNYWDKTCSNLGSSKDAFRLLKCLRTRDAPAPSSHKNISISNVMIVSPQAQANAFGAFFSRREITEGLPVDFSTPPSPLTNNFTYEEFTISINKTKNRAPGPDKISATMIRSLSEANKRKLLDSINRIWNSGDIPTDWKTSTVIPILKPHKSAEDVKSYRPIALTSVLCKLLERMINKRATNFITRNQLLHPYHFGFLPFKGGDVALYTIFNQILIARAKQEYVVLISLDITGAYDSVWHDGFAIKGLQLGLPGHIIWWIHQFLQDRSIKVRWGNANSALFGYKKGTPQGCVLSPTIFAVYMSDLLRILPPECKGVVYADDIFIVCSAPSRLSLRSRVTEAIKAIQKWCSEWKLSLEPTKSAIIEFSNKRDKPEFNIRIGNGLVPWNQSLKILGITFANNLSFKEHFSAIRSKSIQRLNYLKAVSGRFWGANREHIRKLAQMCVRSLLDYGSHITLFASKTEAKILETIYNQISRFSTGLPKWTPIPVLRAEAGALTSLDRSQTLALSFLIKHISLREFSPVNSIIEKIDEVASSATLNRIPSGMLLSKFLMSNRIISSEIIPFTYPTKVSNILNISILTNELPFQSRDLPPCIVTKLFESHRDNFWKERIVLATDCSKSADGVAVAYIDTSSDVEESGKIHPLNSTFTGEACAIQIAIQKRVTKPNHEYVVCSDSLSTLQALRNIDLKSPTIILQLGQLLLRKSAVCTSLTLAWVPAHVGIDINEKADAIAKKALSLTNTSPWVSPSDLRIQIKKEEKKASQTTWSCSKYAQSFPHLSAEFPNMISSFSRAEETLLARFRTRTLPSKSILHKVNLEQSPFCSTCKQPDTNDHILLSCSKYEQERDVLRKSLGIIPMDYNWICMKSKTNKKVAKGVIRFLRSTNL